MDGLRVTGNPDDTELAVLVALLGLDPRPEQDDGIRRWRDRRREAVRRSSMRRGATRRAQQTR